MREAETIVAYTDGSCRYAKEGSDGGWAARLLYKDRTLDFYGFEKKTTTNRVELIAVLRVLQRVRVGTQQSLLIYSDSMYVIKALGEWSTKWERDNWKTSTGESIKNADLIRKICAELKKHRTNRKVVFFWVRGHSGHLSEHHLHNEYVDRLASDARIGRLCNWTPPPNEHNM